VVGSRRRLPGRKRSVKRRPAAALTLNDERLNPDFFYEWEMALGSYWWSVRAIYRFDRSDRLTALRLVQ